MDRVKCIKICGILGLIFGGPLTTLVVAVLPKQLGFYAFAEVVFLIPLFIAFWQISLYLDEPKIILYYLTFIILGLAGIASSFVLDSEVKVLNATILSLLILLSMIPYYLIFYHLGKLGYENFSTAARRYKLFIISDFVFHLSTIVSMITAASAVSLIFGVIILIAGIIMLISGIGFYLYAIKGFLKFQ